MTTVFTILVCLTFSNPASARYNGCRAPDNGLTFYQSEAECRKMADYYTKIDASADDRAVRMEWKCFSKSVNTWQPTH
jgi:hypothetical protein